MRHQQKGMMKSAPNSKELRFEVLSVVVVIVKYWQLQIRHFSPVRPLVLNMKNNLIATSNIFQTYASASGF